MQGKLLSDAFNTKLQLRSFLTTVTDDVSLLTERQGTTRDFRDSLLKTTKILVLTARQGLWTDVSTLSFDLKHLRRLSVQQDFIGFCRHYIFKEKKSDIL